MEQRLLEIGEWLNANGEAIYGTSAGPSLDLGSVRTTAKPGCVYLHVFDPPAGPLELPKSLGKVKRAYVLADIASGPLPIHETPAGFQIEVPATAWAPTATVIKLEIE